jgi:hypothetical protein
MVLHLKDGGRKELLRDEKKIRNIFDVYFLSAFDLANCSPKDKNSPHKNSI